MPIAGLSHTVAYPDMREALARYNPIGALPEDLGIRPDRTGIEDATNALEDYIGLLLEKGYDGNLGAGNFLVSRSIPITIPSSQNLMLRGAGHQSTRFTFDDDDVTATATSGGSLSSGTYYTMIFGLDGSNNVLGAYAPRSGTVDGATTTAILYTWPAIAGAVKYRLWVGTTRFLQGQYFDLTDLTTLQYLVTTATGTSGTRPDYDNYLFDVTPNASWHPIFEGFSVNGSNRCSGWIKYNGGGSYKYAGRHRLIWAQYFYSYAAYHTSGGGFSRWEHCVHRTCEKGWYVNSADDNQWIGCDGGIADYGWDLKTAVGNEILFPNGYTNNFAAVRMQSGANRNNILGGTLNLNKQAGIILAGDQNELAFTKFAGNSDQTTNTYSDIVITGDKNSLTKPKFVPDAGGKLPKYNIEITGAVTANVLAPQPNGTTWGTAFMNDYTKSIGMENVFERIFPGVTAGIIGQAHVLSATSAIIMIKFSPKRTAPTITPSGPFEIRDTAGSRTVTWGSWVVQKDRASNTVTISGATAGSGMLRTHTTGGDASYIDISGL